MLKFHLIRRLLMLAFNQLRVVLDLIVVGEQLLCQVEVDFGLRCVFPFHRDYASADGGDKRKIEIQIDRGLGPIETHKLFKADACPPSKLMQIRRQRRAKSRSPILRPTNEMLYQTSAFCSALIASRSAR